MPNLTLDNPNWSRVCPRGIAGFVHVGRSDGDVLGHTSDTLYRTGRIDVAVMANDGPSAGQIVASGSQPFNAADQYCTVPFNGDNVPAGTYTVWANIFYWVPEANEWADGYQIVSPGSTQIVVTNIPPAYMQASVDMTEASLDHIVMQVYGTFTDECPNNCSVQMTGTTQPYDANGQPIGSPNTLAIHDTSGSPYTDFFVIDGGYLPRDASTVRFDVYVVVRDPFGFTSTTTCTTTIPEPALRNYRGGGQV